MVKGHDTVLKKSGLKTTKGRAAILHILSNEKQPLDVDGIEERLATQKLSLDNATVYRILEAFVEHSIATRVEFKEGKFRYELATLPHHHHAICTNCGSIQDIEGCSIDFLETSVEDRLNFKIVSHTMDFFGLCAKCKITENALSRDH